MLVADQHSVVRAGIKAVLARQRCKVIEASNGREAVKLVRKHRPHLAVLDIPMPELNGLVAARQMKALMLGTRILLHTAQHDDRDLEDAMHTGVDGFMCKSTDIEMLPEAVKSIMEGHPWYDGLMLKFMEESADAPWLLRRQPVLSMREKEVMQLLGEQRTSKEIAEKLQVSYKTVVSHRQRMMDKLKIRDSVGLARYAIRTKLITA